MSPPDEVAKARARATALTDDGLTREQRRSRRKREVRKVTVADRTARTEVRRLALLVPELAPEEQALRPRTRGDCADGLRPCPYVSCKYHLFLDVSDTGSLTLNFPDLEPEQLVESCALDVADQGAETLEFVGEVLNVTRERIRQIENRALFRVQRRGGAALRSFADEGSGPREGARHLNPNGKAWR